MIFILLGVKAFALGGSFGAVINSLIPAAAGGGTAASSQVTKFDTEKVKQAFDSAMETLQSK